MKENRTYAYSRSPVPTQHCLLARNLAKPVSQDADPEAQLFKDADGHWVAQIVIV